jgi:hypothetical protein
MVLISHRGNINGAIKEKENHPDYLKEALDLGYDVEIDVWLMNDKFFLGHDCPQHKIAEAFFNKMDSSRVWYHAKNASAMEYLAQKKDLTCFWHQNDAFTLTSNGRIWVHVNTKELPQNSICVLPEIRKSNEGIENCYAICSDFIERYKITHNED